MISDSVTMDNRFYELQRTNSQPKPEPPAVRTANHGTTSPSYYASIPANEAPPTTTVPSVGNGQVLGDQSSSTNESESIKAHGYAKVHKPSNTQEKVGGVDHAPPTNTPSAPSTDNINQTAL